MLCKHLPDQERYDTLKLKREPEDERPKTRDDQEREKGLGGRKKTETLMIDTFVDNKF